MKKTLTVLTSQNSEASTSSEMKESFETMSQDILNRASAIEETIGEVTMATSVYLLKFLSIKAYDTLANHLCSYEVQEIKMLTD